MNKIFRILTIAAVALGAMACNNDIDNNITPNGQESVSIRVAIEDQTRVSLGNLEEGKGYKLTFDEGDQLYVVSEWSGADGYFFTYTATEGDNYIFTCTAEGVSSILGTSQYVFHLGYTGGMTDAEGNEVAPSVGGYRCNTAAESIEGVGMVASTSNFGEGTLSMQVSPVLKYSSEYPVTFTSGDTSLFFYHTGWYWGSFKEYTVKTTGQDIYIPLYQPRNNITFSAIIKGEVVKTTTMNFEAGKIYNLGTLEAKPEEAVDGEVNVAIAIDGVFADWDAVTKNVATLPADADGKTILKTLKACADTNYIYGYLEFAVEPKVQFITTLDLDNDPTTGSNNWMLPNVNGELLINSCSLVLDDALYSAPFKYGGYSVGSRDMVTCSPATSIGEGVGAIEFAIARDVINDLITGLNVGIGFASYGTSGTPSGIMPYDGNALVFPVPAAE